MKQESISGKISTWAASVLMSFVPMWAMAQRTYVGDKNTQATELLACPEGTILSGPYIASTSGTQTAQQASDQELEESVYGLMQGQKLYKSFSACINPIKAVRVIGCFGYLDAYSYQFASCNSRGGIDENDDMTEPINFEISFYKMGEDGLPGEQIYEEIMPIKGVNTGVDGTLGPYYFFTANLSEEVKLDEGFFSFSACNNDGPYPECWFFLLGNATSGGYTVAQNLTTGAFGSPYSKAPTSFCFLGDPNRGLASRAIKLNGIVNPTFDASSEYAATTVELINIGETDVDDVTLELYLDDSLVATERIDRTLKPAETFAYTFGHRINLKDAPHTVTVKNVTPNDEHIVSESVSAEITGLLTSQSASNDPLYITKFSLGGQINNASGASLYSDFTDLYATIMAGDTLKASLECAGSEYTHYMKIYIDWNGNGSLSDPGEFVGYSTDGKFNVVIPKGVAEVTQGDKLLRVILSYDDTQATGTYDIGETEDYTLRVVQRPSDPIFSTDADRFELTTVDCQTEERSLTISNTGEGTLYGNLNVGYVLPHSPAPLLLEKPIVSMAETNDAAKQAIPASEYTDYSLSYSGDYDRYVKLADRNNSLEFLNFFPAEMMKSLKGNHIQGIEIYMGTSGKGEIVVYGQKSQAEHGELIASQMVSFEADKLNILHFDTPIEITGDDIWIGLKVPAGGYMIGLDYGPAVKGFSDIIVSDQYYHLTDLGYNTNICMQTDLKCDNAPAVGWLTLGDNSFSLTKDEAKAITFKVNPQDLDADTHYEAAIIARSLDPVSSLRRIPVYLYPTSSTTRIASVSVADNAKVRVLQPKTVIIESDKAISHLTAFRLNGSVVASSMGNKLNMSAASRGVYIVRTVYQDGTDEAFTVVIK